MPRGGRIGGSGGAPCPIVGVDQRDQTHSESAPLKEDGRMDALATDGEGTMMG